MSIIRGYLLCASAAGDQPTAGKQGARQCDLYRGVGQSGQGGRARSYSVLTVSLRPVAGKWREAIAEVRSVIADAVAAPPSQYDIDRELALFHHVRAPSLTAIRSKPPRPQPRYGSCGVDIRETIAAPQTVLQVFEAMRNQFSCAPPRVQGDAGVVYGPKSN